jgi:hypothetical protein
LCLFNYHLYTINRICLLSSIERCCGNIAEIYDFYLKADDDTFVFVDNLRKFLSDKNRTSPVTYGWDFHCYVHRGYHSGGLIKK